MNGPKEIIGSAVGTALSATGTALQTNELLQMISLIITIVGGIISFIIIPICNWYKEAKKDGKITAEEIKEGVETVSEGIEKVTDIASKTQEENKNELQ